MALDGGTDRSAAGAVVMDGRRVSDEIVAGVRSDIQRLDSPRVRLATVLVGGDDAARTYIAMKHARAAEVGIDTVGIDLPGTTPQAAVESAVTELAADETIHGLFVQLPLPEHLDASSILSTVPVDKDIDGLSASSLGQLVLAAPVHVPCTPLSVIRLLERYGVELDGRRAVVVGHDPFVALPSALLLMRQGCVTTITDASAHDFRGICREADILVSTVGRPRLITDRHVRPGAAVVDAGSTRLESGIVGDVDLDSVQDVAGAIAPMPGGVGPMTIACLLEHTLDAAKRLGLS